MPTSCQYSAKRHLLAGVAVAALLVGTSSIADPQLSATGFISVTGGGAYADSADNQPVNIIPYVSDGANSGFIHAYADPSGVFGSRASGQGVYTVTATSTIAGTLVNTSAFTQMAVLHYDLSAGDVYVGGAGTESASLTFTISANGGTVGSAIVQEAVVHGSESLHTVSSNIAGFTTSGYSGAPGFVVPSQSGVVDLGLVGAGASINYSYSIASYVTGTNDTTSYTTVARTEYIPYGPYTTQIVPCGYGGYGCGPPQTIIVPAGYQQETVEVLVPTDANNYAEARSGDPLNVGFGNGQNGGQGFDPTITVTGSTVTGGFAAVPEPSTYALVAAGLGLVRLALRRRRTSPRGQPASEASHTAAAATAGSALLA